jgi:hypothetical protein
MNCQFCGKQINNAGSLKAHENVCKQNPNAVKKVRSPLAGAKKGHVAWNKGKKTGRIQYWKDRYPLEEVMVENSSYTRHSLKARILEENLIEYRCACCGIGPEWNGNPMPLILDHINGINNDNRLVNLRFVCSNCDTQLPTYKAKNKGR